MCAALQLGLMRLGVDAGGALMRRGVGHRMPGCNATMRCRFGPELSFVHLLRREGGAAAGLCCCSLDVSWQKRARAGGGPCRLMERVPAAKARPP